MNCEVGVTASIECAHRDDAGRIHGHSYTVEVWFPKGPDLVTLAAFVRDAAGGVDHTMLEDSIGGSKMEDIAAWFLRRFPLATRTVVRRPTLGLAAVAWAAEAESDRG
jgi:6-pyruvoyl-tetrahydropterin synthase